MLASLYSEAECIATGRRTTIFKAKSVTDAQHVVIKMHTKPYCTPKELARFHKEYNIGRDLHHSSHVVKYLSFIQQKDREGRPCCMVVMEDCGDSLQTKIPERGFSVQNFLQIGIQLTKGLRDIHKYGITHRDIKPSNIVLDDSGKVKYIDFGCASRLREEVEQMTTNPEKLYCTFRYMSPEQTGKINRSIDYRTDFYSLGVTFYQLLTGSVPYKSNDPLELFHCHVAVEPPKLPDTIPSVLQQIVFKLLGKDAASRYQSCQGILYDLETCEQELVIDADTCYIRPFEIAQADFSERFTVSKSKLYGRDAEIKVLLDTFDSVLTTKKSQVLIVSGYPGIGKSSLINEIQRPVTFRKSYFVSGKFDQLSTNVAYSAITIAFQTLIKQILAESKERIMIWKKKILVALKNYGKIIIDVIPDLELLIGAQPPVSELAPQEAKNRFDTVFRRFIGAFTDQVLVVFLDDIQWADQESLQFLKLFLEYENILCIAAYRDNEVNTSHPTMIVLDEIRKEKATPIKDIILSPLPFPFVLEWINDTLFGNNPSSRQKTRDAHALSELVHQKTEGNPFFIKIFLQSLHEEGLIALSDDGARWEWDLERIRNQPATDNVIDLMIHRIVQFNSETRKVLEWASCLGNQFDITKLCYILEQDVTELSSQLFPVLNAGLGTLSENEFRFAHDRVQEAIYSLLTDLETHTMHARIGSVLMEHCTIGKKPDFFEAVDHINKGRSLLHTKDLIVQLAKYNLQAALMAKESAALSSVMGYLQEGVACFNSFGNDPWKEFHDLGFSLHKELAIACSVAVEYEKSNNLIDELLRRGKNRVEIGEAYVIRANQDTVRGQIVSAFLTVATGLKAFGIDIKDETAQEAETKFSQLLEEIDAKMKKLHFEESISLSYIKNLPPPTDDFKIMCSLLVTMLPAVYLAFPHLLGVISAIGFMVMLDNRIAPEAGPFVMYMADALIMRRDYLLADRYSKLSLKIAEEIFPEELNFKVQVNHLYMVFISHCFEHVHNCVSKSKQAMSVALECGNFAFAGYTQVYFLPQLLYTGGNISDACDDLVKVGSIGYRTKNQTALGIMRAVQYTFDVLQGHSAENPEELLQYLEETSNVISSVHLQTFMIMLRFIFDDDTVGDRLEYSKKVFNEILQVEKSVAFVTGLFCNPYFKFVSSLMMLRMVNYVRGLNDPIEKEMQQKLDLYVIELEDLAKQSPVNWLNKVQILRACMAGIENRFWDFFNYLDEAYNEADKQGFSHESAMAFEMGTKFALRVGKEKLAKRYFKKALKRYSKWGATYKVQSMMKRYPQLVPKKKIIQMTAKKVGSKETSTLDFSLASQSLESILRASQVISSTIDMDDLLLNIMRIIMETAGASSGAIIIGGTVQAQFVNGPTICSIPLDSWNDGCRAIVEYVTRTLDSLVIADATTEKEFGFIESNPYIVQNNIKSVLCMPVTHQNTLKAILYVENNLMSNCFTEERIDTLSILTTQMAISLENSLSFKTRLQALEELAEVQRVRAHEADLYRKKQEEFIDRICHEIRNPVQGIMGTCSMIKAELDELPPDTLRLETMANLTSYVDAILLCTKHQKIITDDVLTLSKLEFEKVSLASLPFTPSLLVDPILKMFSAELQTKHLTVHKSFKNCDMLLLADSNRLNQILINLIANAIKFTQNGSISISCVQRPITATTVELLFNVADTGCGIEKKNIPNLFNRFEQITQRTSEYGGSGLGLFISKNLIKLMGGDITCESELDKGTRFTFTIICQIADSSYKIEPSPRTPLTPHNVVQNYDEKPIQALVVEDNKINQRVLQRMLQIIGCDCIIGNDGIEGFEQYTNNHVDIIFMDVSMPRVDGYECTRRIRQLEKERGIKHPVPIVGISGNARPEFHQQGMEAGMTMYLNKPVSRDDIVNVLKNIKL